MNASHGRRDVIDLDYRQFLLDFVNTFRIVNVENPWIAVNHFVLAMSVETRATKGSCWILW